MKRFVAAVQKTSWALAILGASLVAWPSHAAKNDSQDIRVDQVEVLGVKSVSESEVQGVFEIAEGDRLDRAKVVRTAERLQALYRSHGYDKAGISTRIYRNRDSLGREVSVLEFAVNEGLPTRVASIGLKLEDSNDESGKISLKRLESTLISRLGFGQGEIFDQERIAAGRRAILETLAAEDFIGAKVGEIQDSVVEAPAGASQDIFPADHWVRLDFKIDLGERVSFGFRGNKVFDASFLSALVNEQRVLGLGKDYLGAIRARIEAEYRAKGYANAQAIPQTFERSGKQERHVTYHITEGQRVTIDSVDFDGNSGFTNEELREQFNSRASGLIQSGYYFDQDVERAAERVVEWIKSRGHLAAKLVTINRMSATSRKPKNPSKAGGKTPLNSVKLVIYLYEGGQTLTQSISIKGVNLFSQDEVLKMLQVQEGAPLNLFAFGDGIDHLKAAYRARGYLDAKIVNESADTVVKYSQENLVADIELEVSEGPQFRVSRVNIEGLTKTDEDIVLRELRFKEGDVLEESRINESEANLRKLAIFSVVSIRTQEDPNDREKKVVEVSLQEGSPGIISGGVGLRNDLGVRVFAESGYTNLFGRNHTVSASLSVNRRFEDFRFEEVQAQLAYRYPWFLLEEMTFRPTLTFSKTQYINLDAQVVSAALTWEYPVVKAWNLYSQFTYSLEGVRQFNARVYEVDNQNFRIGAITPSLRIDRRDNPLAPTAGWFASTSFELAAPAFLSQTDPFPVGYYRFQARGDYHKRLLFGIGWYFSARVGIERSNEAPNDQAGSGAIPYIKVFTLGGASSLRGFKEQEINLTDQLVRSIASYVNYRTQLDFPVFGALRFGPFLDAGNVIIKNTEDQPILPGFNQLRFGTGFGIRYLSPVGPVSLDWGFKIKPRPGEDTVRFYFSIGVI